MRDDSVMRASFVGPGVRTGIDRLYERGSLRLRLPRAHGRCEAILINTGGGLAGGDRVSLDLALGAGADVTMTSQAAEKVYRAEDTATTIATRMSLDAGSRLAWLPQETILHDGAHLMRTLDADIDATATLTLLEIMVLGRIAHGEHLRHGHVRDRWRVRRAGRLAFAEDVRLAGPIGELLERPALGGGARALATLLHVAPDAETRLAAARQYLQAAAAQTTCEAACSAWNGMLLARFAGTDPAGVRAAAAAVARSITDAPMPRSWSC